MPHEDYRSGAGFPSRRGKVDGRRNQGFTLIEVLIVVVVLGILAAIVIFNLGGVNKQAVVAACESDLKTVQIAVQAYEAQNAGSVPTLNDLSTGASPYLQSLPVNNNYSIVLSSSGVVEVTVPGQQGFLADCSGVSLASAITSGTSPSTTSPGATTTTTSPGATTTTTSPGATTTTTSPGATTTTTSPGATTTTTNPPVLVITASSSTVTYGSAVPSVTPLYSGFVNRDTSASLASRPTCTTSYTTTSAAGVTASTTCSGAVDPNYRFSYVAGSISVVPAVLTITASDQSVSSSQQVHSSSTLSGFIAPDAGTLSQVAYTYVGTGGTNYQSQRIPTGRGTYSVIPSAATVSFSRGSSANYMYHYVAGQLTIGGRNNGN